MYTIHRVIVAGWLALASLMAFPAGAQEFPSRAIKLIVANSAGSPPDIIARIVATEMAKTLNQPVVVENKPGADNIVGYEFVARQAPADGYTVLLGGVGALASLPVIARDLRFDPLKDLPPLIGLVESRLVLASSTKLPWKTFAEMAAYARANPGKMNYGESGAILRLMTEALVRNLGLEVTHVPYSGTGAYLQALTVGEVQIGFLGVGAAMPLVAADRLRVIAVTGDQRRPPLADVPTLTELGNAQIPSNGYSLNVRAGIPKDAFDKLYAAASRALKQGEVKARFDKIQYDVVEQAPDVAARTLMEQARFLADVARKVGIKPQ